MLCHSNSSSIDKKACHLKWFSSSSVVLLGSINGMVDYYLRDVVLTDRYGLFHDPCGEPRARNRASAQLDRNQGQHAG